MKTRNKVVRLDGTERRMSRETATGLVYVFTPTNRRMPVAKYLLAVEQAKTFDYQPNVIKDIVGHDLVTLSTAPGLNREERIGLLEAWLEDEPDEYRRFILGELT